MTVDVDKFTAALDRVFRTYASHDAGGENFPTDLGSTQKRSNLKAVEQSFQMHLQRARAAFLQEFRNHAVVIDNEVLKIRKELTTEMEEKYGEKISNLREQVTEAAALLQRHREEIAQLKKLAAAQETYLTAVRHQWSGMERHKKEAEELRKELEASNFKSEELSQQLRCSQDKYDELRSTISDLSEETKKMRGEREEEKIYYQRQMEELQESVKKKEDQFKKKIELFQDTFQEYRKKTADELKIQVILNNRRAEALLLMEEERQIHMQARAKPTQRIGPMGEEEEEEVKCEPYELATSPKYRVDPMGMDTSWRDYKLNDMQLVPQARKQALKFHVERVRRVVPSPGSTMNQTALSGETSRTLRTQMLALGAEADLTTPR